jgi:hypothetical protein
MSPSTIVLTCPTCKRSCRTQGEIRPRARMRCPGCDGLFYFFVHGNGAVELRPVDDEPSSEPSGESRLPPRVGAEEDGKRTRTILTSRRRNRAIGGYMPFEKSRSYIGMFALIATLGVGSLAAYVYFNKFETMSKATGRSAANVFKSEAEAKTKAYKTKEAEAIKKLKDRQAKGQAAGAPAGVGQLPGGEKPEGKKGTE